MNEGKGTIYTDRARQLRGMIRLHDRAARAYRIAGNEPNAQQAEAQRERCKAELAKIEGGQDGNI